MYKILLLVFWSTLGAFTQVDIQISIENLNMDTIYIGKYLGRKLVKETPILKSGDGNFYIRDWPVGISGLFNIVFNRPGEQFNRGFPVVINEQSNQYKVICNALDPEKTTRFIGSTESEAYFNYTNELHPIFDEYAQAVDHWRISQQDIAFDKVVSIEKKLAAVQKSYVAKYPGSLVETIIKITPYPDQNYMGIFEEKIKQRQLYFDKSFTLSPSQLETFWSCPQSILWLDMYAIRSHDRDMQVAAQRVTRIVEAISSHAPGYQYYTQYLLNSFQRLSKNNLDEIYVALVRNFVLTNKTPWIYETEKSKHELQAKRINDTKVGALAPNAVFYKEDNTAISLYSIPTPYTLLVFWAPDCSHCKKELPMLVSKLNAFHNKKIQVISACTKLGKDLPSCYAYLKENLPGTNWIHTGDLNNTSQLGSRFNVSGTPCIYLLDQNKKIVYKRRGQMEEMEWDILLANLK